MADRDPPRGIDVSTPNAARIYDYMLGGKDNFAADREAAEKILTMFPESRDGVRHNRRFLGQTVRHLAGETGIRQFLDIGAGLPTQDNVHEAARSVNPAARTVYVDNDPVVCVHGRAILAGSPGVAVLEGDLREPEKIVSEAAATGLVDWAEPVAVLLVAVLHFLPDPYEQVALLRDAMAPGSHLVITHMTRTEQRALDTEQVQDVYAASSSNLFPRTVAEVAGFFGDFEMIDQSGFIEPALQRKFAVLGMSGVGRKTAP
ncbi:SAM-dependent methyltransferase [Microbispora corallina]|uniref:SAM-dependent methyltransferase n=1 Tax=Microbispora corallina TaxID=83302 RepID=A0ABQ4FXR3_9ACTN|nr:SAM-dependent methyltransferase [Microbispora corallina]GIH39609.1 hypothetical protein Mco01_26090 [Microbispora corallina]